MIGSSNLGLIAFVVFYGLDWVATVPPTVAITAEAFGREHVGVVFGWIFGAHQLGAAVAAWGAGAARTWFGDYQSAFITAGLISLLAVGSRDPHHERRGIRSAGRAEPGRSARMKRARSPRPRRRRARGRARRSRRRSPAARRRPHRPPARSSTRAPRTVVIRLTEHSEPVGDGISVTGPDGREVAHGPVVVGPSSLTRAIDARQHGSYVVEWLAVGSDSHPARGAFFFSVGEPTDAVLPGPARAGRMLEVLGRWLSLLGFALGFGVPFAALLSGGMTARLWRLVSAGSRADDRGRARRPARPDGAPRRRRGCSTRSCSRTSC